MKRKAILIDSGDTGSQPLNGTAVDVKFWSEYLISNCGGAWNSSEIVVLKSPSVEDLKVKLQEAKLVDFAFVSFSGHGYAVASGDKYTPPITKVDINRTTSIDVRQLNPGCKRAVVIADSCRQLVSEEMLKSASSVDRYVLNSADVSSRHRNQFDNNVLQAAEGCVFCFGCDVGQTSGETPTTGGFYSSQLMKASEAWYNSTNGQSVLSIAQAHDLAVSAVSRLSLQQVPQYDGGRRSIHFPLAVKA